MNLGIRGRTALVAAGSKGLGRAVAEALAAEGVTVAICARGREALDAAVAGIRGAGGAAHGFVADVSKPDEAAALVGRVTGEVGPIDILVTNSGGPRAGTFDMLSDQDWADAVQLLLTSAVTMTRAVLPGMRERHWGRILMVTSIAVKQPVANLMLSNSLRAGVTGFARTLANEVAAEGITVNTILPGYTRTDRVVDLAQQMASAGQTTPEAVYGRWEAEIPMRRIGEPREFGAMAAFLASEQASYVTGQAIAVDGGWIKSLV
jgi:3-oxoacyl-[acyl-carrier protein] reductase